MGVLENFSMRRRAAALAAERVPYFRLGEWVRLGGYRDNLRPYDLRQFCLGARRLFNGCKVLSAYSHMREASFRAEALDTLVSAVAYLGGRGGAAWDAAAAGKMAADLFYRLERGGEGAGPAPLTLVESVRTELSGFFVGHCLEVVDD